MDVQHSILSTTAANRMLSKDKIPFQQLPSEVIDLILIYLFPVSIKPSVSKEILDILPLATTCNQLFSRMAKIAITYFTSLSVHANEHVLRLPHLAESDPVRRHVLFQLASIGIQNIALQLSYNSNQQRDIEAMLKNIMNINAHSFSEIRFRPKTCSQDLPLFDPHGHTAKCCSRLAWLAFLASSNSELELQLDIRWKCLSKFGQLLNLPVKKIFVKDISAPMNEIRENLQSFSSTVTDLSVKISPNLFEAISQTSLPNLRSLTITGPCCTGDPSERCLVPLANQILKRLRDNGSRLTSIRLGSSWLYSSGYEAVEAIDLNNLGPTIRHLAIFFALGRSHDRHIISQSLLRKVFRLCRNIETFECLSYEINFGVLTAFHHSGILPNLKRILLRDMIYIYFQPLPEIFDAISATKETVKLIEEYGVVRYIGDENIQSMDFLLSHSHHIQKLSLSFRMENIPEFIQVLRQCHSLTSLNFKIPTRYDRENLCYYSKFLVDAIFDASSSLEELDISSCMLVDESINLLKVMGKRAKIFRVPITDEDVSIYEYETMSLEFCSLDDVMKILNTIEMYCPNLETFKIFDYRTVCKWDSKCFDIIEGKMKSLKATMKSLQNSFFEDWRIIKDKSLRIRWEGIGGA